MDERHNQTQPGQDSTPTQPAPVGQSEVEPTQPVVTQTDASGPKKNGSFGTLLVLGAVVLAVAAAALWYFGNQSDEVNTTGIPPEQVVATVNGVDILGADLTTSIGQITTTAQLQGIDTTDPSVQSEIQVQAVEMLVNTELLEQEAAERGINVNDAEVEARITALVEEIGSEELLNERMMALGIDDETLREDVKSELMIQALLDQVFDEAAIVVTEEEVESVYETSTGGSAEAPALAEIRPQVEAQIRTSKEQTVVTEFITELRNEAEVVIP